MISLGLMSSVTILKPEAIKQYTVEVYVYGFDFLKTNKIYLKESILWENFIFKNYLSFSW